MSKQLGETQHFRFVYGDETLTFTRVARTKNGSKVLIKVLPDCQVIAAAPEQASDENVINAVKKRARWIYQQLNAFRQQQEYLTARVYVSGESHYYLGRQYQLKVIETQEQPQGVKLLQGKLEVYLKRKTPQKVQQLLTDWYKSRAKAVFSRRLDILLEQALWVSDRPPLRVLNMKTQWGSCSPKGRLTLNPHLVKASTESIDYVILHELCHLAEHNHSERFYRLMGQVMPDWEKRKTRLDSQAHQFLNQ